MMQSCASAAKLRSGGPILPVGVKAKGLSGLRHLEPSSALRHKRADKAETIGIHQRSPLIVPDALRRRPGQHPPARAATGRSVACAPRPRSWAFEYRERSRCGIETISSRRCPSDVEGTATLIKSCLVGPGRCLSGFSRRFLPFSSGEPVRPA